ncbi:MAG: M48 family metallopeptidase [Ruminococcaceae bacterium]|nr:M48 family metallopeptidase [Oscillospiraceae bacterium]
MAPLEYRVIRSSRKTLCLQWKNNELLVRAPKRTSEETIAKFVERHRDWVEKRLQKKDAQGVPPPLTEAELEALYRRAREVLPKRVAYFAPLVGVTYGRVTVRCQKTKWGSCSGKGNLNFNCLLMLTPSEVIDYLVVHELCHRKEMNHSSRFYRLVERVLPNYRAPRKWLKEHGGSIIGRRPQ